MRLEVRRARCPGCSFVDLDHFADLWALLPWTGSDLEASALRHAAVSCCLQEADVEECIGCAASGVCWSRGGMSWGFFLAILKGIKPSELPASPLGSTTVKSPRFWRLFSCLWLMKIKNLT